MHQLPAIGLAEGKSTILCCSGTNSPEPSVGCWWFVAHGVRKPCQGRHMLPCNGYFEWTHAVSFYWLRTRRVLKIVNNLELTATCGLNVSSKSFVSRV